MCYKVRNIVINFKIIELKSNINVYYSYSVNEKLMRSINEEVNNKLYFL